MGFGLRQLRSGRAEEIPKFYEGVALRPFVSVAGWIVGISAILGGIVLMATGAASWVENAGAGVGTVGALIMFGLLKFHRCELLLGKRWLMVRVGPVRHQFGLEAFESIHIRPARVWRMLFSSVEAELGLPSLGRVLVFPTRDPETLRHELENVAAEV
ncbi:MAG: hypothetical protein GXP48_08275 [Acidobacteria bacterium]|nr:hypothetical protein [Acidobacteriota bacterium]